MSQSSHRMSRWVKCAVQWFSPALLATSVLFTPASQAQDKVTNGRIEALADKYDLPNLPVSPGQSRIVFYRPSQTSGKGAASVYINGRYHASLVPGGFSPICIPTGTTELGVRFMDVNNRPNKDGFDSITELKTQSTKNYYIRVNNQGSRAIALTPVSAAEATRELAATRLQVHTISRVADATDCVETLATQTAAPSRPQQLQLSGDTLFAFNRSDAEGLTQQGFRAISQLLTQIQNEFSQVDRLHVIGHTDPIGDARANERLSIARAQTIRDFIASRQDFRASAITAEGRGERELAVTHCGDVNTPSSVACNQANRRVVVEVTGLHRPR
jgi:OOP family OmpA-OmpF porin